MKTTAIIAALLTAATVSPAAIPPIVKEIEANYQQTQTLDDQDFVQGAGVSLQYKLKSGSKWLSLAGLGARWDARSSATSTQAVQAVATVVTSTTPHYFQITLDSTQTGSAVTNWVYSLIVTDGGVDYPLGVGDLDIAASTWTGAAAVLSNVTAAAYTDAAVATHAAVKATTNSLGHVIVGSGLSVDGDGVLSNPQSVPSWDSVTDKPAAITTYAEAMDQDVSSTGTPTFASVQLSGGTGSMGTLTFTNSESRSLEFDAGNGVVGQVNEEFWVNAKNASGLDIPDGTVVCKVPATSNSGRVEIEPFIADGSIEPMMLLGVTTEAITNGGWGKVTTDGNVGSYDTSSWPYDSILYASDTVAGALQTNAPTAESSVVIPLAVTLDSKLDGKILVRMSNLDLNKYVTKTDSTYTNAVQRTGDTVTGSILSTVDHLTTAPASDEFPTAVWVRSLTMQGAEWFFTDVATNGFGEKTANFVALSADTPVDLFTNSIASPVASETYLAGGVATQAFGAIRSPVTFEVYANRVGGNVSTVIPVYPEVYYIYNGTTNHLGDYGSVVQAQNITATTPTKYTFTVAFPEPSITGAVHLVAYLKSGTVSGTAAGINIYGGDGLPSHLDIDSVNAGETAADVAADLAAHEALTGAQDAHGLSNTVALASTAAQLAGDNVFTGNTNSFNTIKVGDSVIRYQAQEIEILDGAGNVLFSGSGKSGSEGVTIRRSGVSIVSSAADSGNELRSDWTTTGNHTVTSNITAQSYALTGNRRAITAAVDLSSVTAWTNDASAAFTQYSFGTNTTDFTLYLTGPGTGYLADAEIYFADSYTNRAVTITNATGNLTWIGSEPTTSQVRILADWIGTNVNLIATWGE